MARGKTPGLRCATWLPVRRTLPRVTTEVLSLWNGTSCSKPLFVLRQAYFNLSLMIHGAGKYHWTRCINQNSLESQIQIRHIGYLSCGKYRAFDGSDRPTIPLLNESLESAPSTSTRGLILCTGGKPYWHNPRPFANGVSSYGFDRGLREVAWV